MPIYDCGDPDCASCQAAFGPNREKAIARYHERTAEYARLEAAAAQPSEREKATKEALEKLLVKFAGCARSQGNGADIIDIATEPFRTVLRAYDTPDKDERREMQS